MIIHLISEYALIGHYQWLLAIISTLAGELLRLASPATGCHHLLLEVMEITVRPSALSLAAAWWTQLGYLLRQIHLQNTADWWVVSNIFVNFHMQNQMVCWLTAT